MTSRIVAAALRATAFAPRVLPPLESGISARLARAITAGIDDEIVAFRSRAIVPELYDFGSAAFPCKPGGAKTLGANLPDGVRFVVTKEGKLALVVSDLDAAWAVRDGRLLADQQFTSKLQDAINNAYGSVYDIINHGPHVNGVMEDLGVPIKNLGNTEYVFNAQGYLGSGPMLDALQSYAPAEADAVAWLRSLLAAH